MTKTRQVRHAAVVGALAALVAMQLLAGVTVAGAQQPGGGRIRPHQTFGALVNGENGKSSPVEIQIACSSTAKSGATGHPVAGQTVTVFQPEVIAGRFGNTGANGHEIGAFFGAPPPAAGASGGAVIFRRYLTKKIPVSEVLPCSGTGNVTFVPLPMSPGSEKDVVVPVTYVS